MNLKGVTNLRSNLVKDENDDLLADSQTFRIGGRTTTLSY
jgi:hypothetical protein